MTFKLSPKLYGWIPAAIILSSVLVLLYSPGGWLRWLIVGVICLVGVTAEMKFELACRIAKKKQDGAKELVRMSIKESDLLDARPPISVRQMYLKMAIVVILGPVPFLVLGSLAGMNGVAFYCIIIGIAVAFGLLTHVSQEDRDSIAWWNGLTKSEREYWLMQGGTGEHADAWEAYRETKAG